MRPRCANMMDDDMPCSCPPSAASKVTPGVRKKPGHSLHHSREELVCFAATAAAAATTSVKVDCRASGESDALASLSTISLAQSIAHRQGGNHSPWAAAPRGVVGVAHVSSLTIFAAYSKVCIEKM